MYVGFVPCLSLPDTHTPVLILAAWLFQICFVSSNKVLAGIDLRRADHESGDGQPHPEEDMGIASGVPAVDAARAGFEPHRPDENLVIADGAPAVEAARAGLEPHQPDEHLIIADGAPAVEAARAGLEPHQIPHEDAVAAGGVPAVVAARPAGRGAVKRSEKWPQGSSSTPWQLAPIMNQGTQIGWGATCSCHTNAEEVASGKNIQCKKQVITSAGTTHGQTRLLAMQWLVKGGMENGVDHAEGRHEHVFNTQPRTFERVEEAELEAMAMSLWP